MGRVSMAVVTIPVSAITCLRNSEGHRGEDSSKSNVDARHNSWYLTYDRRAFLVCGWVEDESSL